MSLGVCVPAPALTIFKKMNRRQAGEKRAFDVTTTPKTEDAEADNGLVCPGCL